jgi:hypothetical protein
VQKKGVASNEACNANNLYGDGADTGLTVSLLGEDENTLHRRLKPTLPAALKNSTGSLTSGAQAA